VKTARELENAAVLAPVFRDVAGVLRILLLLRTDRGIHGGQLGLPGGRPEPVDEGSFLATALREAEEEVGLPPSQVEVLAALEPLETMATGFRVYPFLGVVPADVEWRLQPDEVARLLTPAVEDLGEGAERRRLPFRSSYFERSIEVEGIEVDGHVLWGMTLRLLDGLVPRLLAGEWEV
jgi:8-oxo-dGTP pyrophosphatase MutT (NUDIX family)